MGSKTLSPNVVVEWFNTPDPYWGGLGIKSSLGDRLS
jgi:hypothetical protein